MVKRKQNTFHVTKQKLLPIKWKPAVPGTPYFFSAEFFQGNTKFLGQAVTHSPAEQLWGPKLWSLPLSPASSSSPSQPGLAPEGHSKGKAGLSCRPSGRGSSASTPHCPGSEEGAFAVWSHLFRVAWELLAAWWH